MKLSNFSLTQIASIIFFTAIIFFSKTTNAEQAPEASNNIYIADNILQADILLKNATHNTKTLQLFTHGKPGMLHIENSWKDKKAIANWLRAKQMLKQIEHLNIYGCEFAKGEKGKAAVQFLETELSITIAASDDITGIDGDWELEVGIYKEGKNFTNYPNNLQVSLPMDKGEAVLSCHSAFEGNISSIPDGFVLGLLDIRDPLGNNAPVAPSIWTAPAGSNVYHHPSWTNENLGEIFGVAIEEGATNPDIFVSTTGSSGTTLHTNLPATGGTGGEVTRIDGTTGNILWQTSLPNTFFTNGNFSKYVGLGQITYNPDLDFVYVTNVDDGLIYILNGSTGAQLGTYNPSPSVPDDPNELWTPLDRMVYGIKYNQCDERLYYYKHPGEIRSVELSAFGLPETSTDRLEFVHTVNNSDPFREVISDISFPDGCCGPQQIAISEKGFEVQTNSEGFEDWTLRAHYANPFTYNQNPDGTWSQNQKYLIGEISLFERNANGAGGIDYGFNNYGPNPTDGDLCIDCNDALVTTTDATQFDNTNAYYVWGLMIVDILGMQSTGIDNGYLIDIDNDTARDRNQKFIFGDIEVYGQCDCVCESLAGEIFVDSDNNGCMDGTDALVTASVGVMLFTCGDDPATATPLATATVTDGSYEFGTDATADADICLTAGITYFVVFDIPNASGEALDGYVFSAGTAVCTAGMADDSPTDDGVSGCYDPADDDATDTDTDEHIDVGILPGCPPVNCINQYGEFTIIKRRP